MQPKKRGRPGKSKTNNSDSLSRSNLNRIRSKGIFETARSGEKFGPHPGYVDLKIRISVYNSITQREEKLPGKEIGLLISSIEEVDSMIKVITEVLTDWAAGLYAPRK